MRKMKTKPILFSVYIILIILVFGLILIYQYLHDRGIKYPSSLRSDFENIVYYEIIPDTIHYDLENGKPDVFKKTVVEPDTILKPTFWRQEDFIQIASTFHEFAWDEDSNKWLINAMSFGRVCSDNPVGFESGDVSYYKQINQNSYKVHQIYILPEWGEITSGESNFRRPLFGWTAIYLNKFKVNADDALQIAEEQGAEKFRTSIYNDCSIVVAINPNPENNGWLVGYFSNNGASNFIIYINPYTGLYTISK